YIIMENMNGRKRAVLYKFAAKTMIFSLQSFLHEIKTTNFLPTLIMKQRRTNDEVDEATKELIIV
ncbi:hypothetical protein ACJX0J_038144, partial [Zea mays]